jgi:uncharacterized protein
VGGVTDPDAVAPVHELRSLACVTGQGARHWKGEVGMATRIFVNLPVQDLDQSMAFFAALGYRFSEQFTDETAACMVISDDIYTMLLTEAKFREFTPKALCDATAHTEVLLCLSCDSRAQVDEQVAKAVAAGGRTYREPMDYGFMYGHGFEDLDGHLWELIYMEPGAVREEPRPRGQ